MSSPNGQAAGQPGQAQNGTHHANKGHHHHHNGTKAAHGKHMKAMRERAFGIDIKEKGHHHRHHHKGHHKGHHNGTAKGHEGNGTANAGKEAANKAAHTNKGAQGAVGGSGTNPQANDGPCPGCSIPLDNEVGAFSTDHVAAGAFALNFLAFIAGAGLLGFSFFRTRPKVLGGSPDLQFYGLRWSLGLFVVSRFFNWIYYAVPNSRSVTLGYLIFYLVPLVFLYASETTLVYTFARTALQPIRQSGGFQRTRAVAFGMTGLFGLIAFIMWILQAVTLGLEINARASRSFDQSLFHALAPEMYIQLISNLLAFIYGCVFLGMGAWAQRKAGSALGASYRRVPQFVMGAAGLWTVRAAFGIIFQVVPAFAARRNASASLIGFLMAEPVISALTENYLLLGAFSVLLLCFREHLSNLYVDGSLNSQIKEDPYVAQNEGLPHP